MKNRRATGTNDDDDVGRRRRSGVSVRSRVSSTSRRPSSSLTGPRPAPRDSAEGVGPVAGPGRLPPVRARALDGPRPGARASLSLSLAANTAGPSCYTAPGRLDDHPSSLAVLSLRGLGARERSRVRRDAAKRGARRGRRGAGSRARAPRDVARYASLSLSLSLVRERESTVNSVVRVSLFASPSQSPLLLRAFVPRAERDLRGTLMILPQVHLRKPCYDFYFL